MRRQPTFPASYYAFPLDLVSASAQQDKRAIDDEVSIKRSRELQHLARGRCCTKRPWTVLPGRTTTFAGGWFQACRGNGHQSFVCGWVYGVDSSDEDRVPAERDILLTLRAGFVVVAESR